MNSSGAEPLPNDQHERFANLVAAGAKLHEAYVEAGYSAKGAKGSSSRLRSHAVVAARIEFLRRDLTDRTMERFVVGRDWVLGGIKAIAENDEAKDADRLRAYELVGKELGMFVHRVGDPDGGPMTEKVEIQFVDDEGEVGEGVPAAH
ncbi:MAG: hypothetical protein AAF360_11240 [Pseudomonadota bacterium]